MKSKMYWGLAILILLLVTAAVFVFLREIADNRDLDTQLTEAEELVEQINQRKISENNKKSELDIPLQPKDTDSENFTAEVRNNIEASGQEQQAPNPAKTAEVTDVPVSPHGFGPYPEVPADFPGGERHWHLYTDPEHELLDRVWIKLWKQDTKAEGITTKRNGLFYPIIKGIRYVEWDTIEYPDGSTRRYVSRSTGHPADNLGGENGPVFESNIPGHLTIYTYPDGGIDPYQFLNLPKE